MMILRIPSLRDQLPTSAVFRPALTPRSGQVLDQIVSRGTLYAVVVHPTNEQHRSVSLNIMHGNPPQGESTRGGLVM